MFDAIVFMTSAPDANHETQVVFGAMLPEFPQPVKMRHNKRVSHTERDDRRRIIRVDPVIRLCVNVAILEIHFLWNFTARLGIEKELHPASPDREFVLPDERIEMAEGRRNRSTHCRGNLVKKASRTPIHQA